MSPDFKFVTMPPQTLPSIGLAMRVHGFFFCFRYKQNIFNQLNERVSKAERPNAPLHCSTYSDALLRHHKHSTSQEQKQEKNTIHRK